MRKMQQTPSKKNCSCTHSKGPGQEEQAPSNAPPDANCPYSNPCVSACVPHGPHQIKRKKYKRGELSTICVQCNYEICGPAPTNGNSIEIQCDIEPESDSEGSSEPICSVCKCTPGFCNLRCEESKMKKQSSDPFQCSKDKNMTIRQVSEPSLKKGKLVAEPFSTCKCTGKCTRECEEMKMKTAMAAVKAAKLTAQETKGNDQDRCLANKCTSLCNKSLKTAPPASSAPDLGTTSGITKPLSPEKTKSSNVCTKCECLDPCSIECLTEKMNLKQLMLPDDDSYDPNMCGTCECTGECNPRCERLKQAKKALPPRDKVCPECKCVGTCSKECMQHKIDLDKEETWMVCSCKTICNAPCDKRKLSYTENATVGEQSPSTADISIACKLCACVGECNPECESIKAANSQTRKSVCDNCSCPNVCPEACESIKMAARKICEECVCNATCLPKCEEAKKNKPVSQEPETTSNVVCKICECCNKCNAECEAAKLGSKRTSKVRISGTSVTKTFVKDSPAVEGEFSEDNAVAEDTPVIETEPNSMATDVSELDSNATTQVKGIIENFDDENITDAMSESQILPDDKNQSACNVAGERICENCTCDEGMCNAKCAAMRQIKSLAEFPPQTTVCDICICEGVCSKPCLEKRNKANTRPVPADEFEGTSKTDVPQISTEDNKDDTSKEVGPEDEVASTSKKDGKICDPCTCTGTCIKVCEENKTKVAKSADANTDPLCEVCTEEDPCSPVCRERLALTVVMPKPPETCNRDSSSQPEKRNEALAQTCPPTSECRKAQTDNIMNRGTSTVDADIHTQQCMPCSENPSAPCMQATTSQPSSGECGMCSKIKGLVCSVFQRDKSAPGMSPCICSPEVDAASEENICLCLTGNERQRQPSASNSCPLPPIPPQIPQVPTIPRMNNKVPCACKSIQRRKTSYTDKMQEMMGQIRSHCNEADSLAAPFYKAASAFDLDIHTQQEAIFSLLDKCRQKDSYIDALIEELLGRSKSMMFDNLIYRLHEPVANSPDFDQVLIANALDKNKKHGNVCGIDLRNFKITGLKRVGATSVLVKWTPPQDPRVNGYEVLVGGQLKAKIMCKETGYAILDALDLTGTIAIENFATTQYGRALPSVNAYYAKY